ncbi:MAG: hypothetical protein J5851_00395 [Oscillospiraceae bacterium]|nr:hypothetical protein [Oscillospiraceae bacterium]
MTEAKMQIIAAAADEVLLTYSDSKAPHDLACVGHLRMHFGGSGTEFQSSELPQFLACAESIIAQREEQIGMEAMQ